MLEGRALMHADLAPTPSIQSVTAVRYKHRVHDIYIFNCNALQGIAAHWSVVTSCYQYVRPPFLGLVLFDLAVFLSTQLPVLVHDSLLFKNVQNEYVSQLLRIYLRTGKQSFVALDEIQKFGPATASLLLELQLRDNDVLYVNDWRERR